MNDIDKIRNAYTEAMKALESGYSHKVKDAITNLITIFEQEYPERTQNQEVAFLQLQVAVASIRYHVFRQDVLSATSSFTLLCEESNKLLKTDILDEHYKEKTRQLIDETEQVLNAFRENLEHIDNSLTGQPSPYIKQYTPNECKVFWRKQMTKVYIPTMIVSLPYLALALMYGENPLIAVLTMLVCGYSIYYFIALILQYYALLPILQKVNRGCICECYNITGKYIRSLLFYKNTGA